MEVYFDRQLIILQDVMDVTEEEILILATANDQGIALNLIRPGDRFPFASVLIENNEGTPLLYYWLTDDMDMDPTKVIPLDSEIDKHYCLKCGQVWAVHNDDGSCVED